MTETVRLDSFGARLEYWRKKRGYNRQGALAEAIGIKQSSLSELESGKSKQPAADVMLKLCDVLHLRPKYLLLGEGPSESQYFQELNGLEAQLVMIFRQLPSDGLRNALMIEANDLLERHKLDTRKPLRNDELTSAKAAQSVLERASLSSHEKKANDAVKKHRGEPRGKRG